MLGIFELIILFFIALIFLGPEKFPQLSKDVARFIHQLRSMKDDIHRNLSFKENDNQKK